MKSIAVVVLGDLGRSPRMQRHVQAILSYTNYHVDLIGYKGSKVKKSIRKDKRVKIHEIEDIKIKEIKLLNKKIFIFSMILLLLKFIFRFYYVFKTLFVIRKNLYYIILQNPPSHPSLLICKLFILLNKKTKLIIDWHNLGYSLINIKYKNNFLTKMYKYFEIKLSKNSFINITVTKKLSKHLRENFNISDSIVIYDSSDINLLKKNDSLLTNEKIINIFNKNIKLNYLNILFQKNKKPILLISSTSWGEDEDFNILLETAYILDNNFSGQKYYFIISGKGPLKEKFDLKVKALNLKHCIIKTVWLENYEDYLLLLKNCDAGLSFHFSSSGMDLPMKIFDMMGCSLPVFALNYPCLKSELINENNQNGFLFESPKTLAKKLKEVFEEDPLRKKK